MGMFGDSGSRDDYLRLESRIAGLEATVARLTDELAALRTGVPAPTGTAAAAEQAYPWLPEVVALKNRGKLIEAIKVARERTGWDLRQSKDFVEGL